MLRTKTSIKSNNRSDVPGCVTTPKPSVSLSAYNRFTSGDTATLSRTMPRKLNESKNLIQGSADTNIDISSWYAFQSVSSLLCSCEIKANSTVKSAGKISWSKTFKSELFGYTLLRLGATTFVTSTTTRTTTSEISYRWSYIFAT